MLEVKNQQLRESEEYSSIYNTTFAFKSTSFPSSDITSIYITRSRRGFLIFRQKKRNPGSHFKRRVQKRHSYGCSSSVLGERGEEGGGRQMGREEKVDDSSVDPRNEFKPRVKQA